MNDIEERIRSITDKSIIIDTLSHGPILWTEPFIKKTDELLALERSPFKIVQELIGDFSRTAASNNDYFEKLKTAWLKSGVDCVSWTVGPIHEKPYSLEGVRHNLAFLTYLIDNRSEFFVKIVKADDIKQLREMGKVGIIYNLQDCGFIGTDIDLLEEFYYLGIRIMQLTYNSKNNIGTGCTARRDRGLTDFGQQVVEKINELRAVVDVSHCGPQTSMDAALHSSGPIIASHTLSDSIFRHDRAKSDDLLRTIADKGGYIGVLTVPGFLTSTTKATINDWLDHIDYIVNIVGIDHVGIGTDYYGYSLPDNLAKKIDELIGVLGFRQEHRATFTDKMQEFESYEKFPNLIKGLISRGYSDTEISKIAGENFLRTFREICG
jgi:membrane dipeptidase